EFVIRTSKQNLNDLVNAYLDKLLSQTKQNFTVVLDEDVELYGELPVFSTTVPLLIRFDPIVQDNGDIALKQKSISVGQLKLPKKKTRKYVNRFYQHPNGSSLIQKRKKSILKLLKWIFKVI